MVDGVVDAPLYGVAAGLGVLGAVHLARPALLAVPAVCLALVVAPRLLDRPSLPDPERALAVERSVERDAVEPGESVGVSLRVTNTGDTWLPAVRIRDAVPEGVAVAGSPDHATSLRPGATTTCEYEATVPRGATEWTTATVTLATVGGRTERTATVDAPATVRGWPRIPSLPLPVRVVSSLFAGRLRTGRPGDGVEFFATREYQPGDPLGRVDWNRLARTGELGTVEYQAEHLASVVVLVDARRAAYLAPGPGREHAVERSVRLARRAFAGLLDAGNRVGVAALSERDVWLPPRLGRDHRATGLDLLTTHEAFSTVPPAAELYADYEESRRESRKADLVDRIDRRFDGRGEVLLCSPCCDPYPGRVARSLDARGHHVTVVSPDPTADRRLGHRVRRLQRQFELRQLRRSEIRAVDWGDEPADLALRRAAQRWSP